jgi:glycosyltransferase involved in cell wall biosynthesis
MVASAINVEGTCHRGSKVAKRMRMRIAQVAPLFESVSPKLYGGTERVVHYLAEELLREGHDVTLFASGDSQTSGRLVAPCESALRLNSQRCDPMAYHILLVEDVFESATEFDIVHFHNWNAIESCCKGGRRGSGILRNRDSSLAR